MVAKAREGRLEGDFLGVKGVDRDRVEDESRPLPGPASRERVLYGIATAYHVVAHADVWRQPIRIIQPAIEKTAFLTEDDRVIFGNENLDSAVNLAPAGEFKFPEHLVQLLPTDSRRRLTHCPSEVFCGNISGLSGGYMTSMKMPAPKL